MPSAAQVFLTPISSPSVQPMKPSDTAIEVGNGIALFYIRHIESGIIEQLCRFSVDLPEGGGVYSEHFSAEHVTDEVSAEEDSEALTEDDVRIFFV